MIKKNKPLKSKKDLIYEKAALLFRAKGYKAASMRDLAELVDLKVSSLYSHIGSKEELLQKICFDNAYLFTNGIDRIEKTETTAVDKIKAIIDLHVDIAVSNPSSVTVFNNEWRHLSNESDDSNLMKFLDLRKDYENRLKKIIVSGRVSGALKNIDPDIALYTILTSVRWIHYWYKPNRKVGPEKLKSQIATLLLNGIVIN
ncbi:MAG: TetR/AcrR family transcriptional regulator [Saprospiraceae bacterium]|nr:TetR/AcrR family transcriptional regulator [Saprospiraceae bacterium]